MKKTKLRLLLLIAFSLLGNFLFAQNLKKNLSVENQQVQSDLNVDKVKSTSTIYLNAKHIDTKSAESQSARKPIANFIGLE